MPSRLIAGSDQALRALACGASVALWENVPKSRTKYKGPIVSVRARSGDWIEASRAQCGAVPALTHGEPCILKKVSIVNFEP
jgi:hypothetical protein